MIPGVPHHVTQSGNGRATTFFCDDDYALYRVLLAEHCAAAAWRCGPGCYAQSRPPDPSHENGLRAALSRTHRRYAGHIHAREKRAGHVWQGRFGCVAMDEAHLAAAVRYVALNPVRARLVERAQGWRWSSVHAHLGLAADDGLTATGPVLEGFPDLAERIATGEDEAMSARLRRAEQIGRPVGDAAFIAALERRTSRSLAPTPRGPKPKDRRDGGAAS